MYAIVVNNHIIKFELQTEGGSITRFMVEKCEEKDLFMERELGIVPHRYTFHDGEFTSFIRWLSVN